MKSTGLALLTSHFFIPSFCPCQKRKKRSKSSSRFRSISVIIWWKKCRVTEGQSLLNEQLHATTAHVAAAFSRRHIWASQQEEQQVLRRTTVSGLTTIKPSEASGAAAQTLRRHSAFKVTGCAATHCHATRGLKFLAWFQGGSTTEFLVSFQSDSEKTATGLTLNTKCRYSER